jgi:hypothetical protein
MLRRFIEVGAIAAVLVALGGTPAAWAAGGATGHGMPWHGPNKITSGVAVGVSSNAPCPAAPTPGDTVLVQITLSFGPGGSGNEVLPANADGSWAGNVTFNFIVPGLRQTTISASCLDFNGTTGTPYAQYMTRPTQIFS